MQAEGLAEPFEREHANLCLREFIAALTRVDEQPAGIRRNFQRQTF